MQSALTQALVRCGAALSGSGEGVVMYGQPSADDMALPADSPDAAAMANSSMHAGTGDSAATAAAWGAQEAAAAGLLPGGDGMLGSSSTDAAGSALYDEGSADGGDGSGVSAEAIAEQLTRLHVSPDSVPQHSACAAAGDHRRLIAAVKRGVHADTAVLVRCAGGVAAAAAAEPGAAAARDRNVVADGWRRRRQQRAISSSSSSGTA